MGNAKYAISILDGGSGLGIGAVPTWSWVQSLIKELRSRKPQSQKKKKKNPTKAYLQEFRTSVRGK